MRTTGIKQSLMFLAKSIGSIDFIADGNKDKWELVKESEAKTKAWRRKKSDGNGYEYLYQDKDPNIKDSGGEGKSEIESEATKKNRYENFVKTVTKSFDYSSFGALDSKPVYSKKDGTFVGYKAGNPYVFTPITPENVATKKASMLAQALYKTYSAAVSTKEFTFVENQFVEASPVLVPVDSQDWLNQGRKEFAHYGFIMDVLLNNKVFDTLGYRLGNAVRTNFDQTNLINKDGSYNTEPGDAVADLMELWSGNSKESKLFNNISEQGIVMQIVSMLKELDDDNLLSHIERSLFNEEPSTVKAIYQKIKTRKDQLMNWAKEVSKKKIVNNIVKRKERYNLPPTTKKGEITESEMFAIKAYTGSNYVEINHILREKEEFTYTEETVNKIKERVENLIRGLGKIPPYTESPVYRGTGIDDHTLMVLSSAKPGDILYMKGFTSTSKTKEGAFLARNLNFTIYSKTGRDISDLSTHPEEAEVLFAPDSRFKIREIDFKDLNDIRIVLDEILPEETPKAIPINTPKKLTAIDVRNFLLKNPKLSVKQRERILKMSSDDLFAIAFAIFSKSEKKGTHKTQKEEESNSGLGSEKFTEIFI